MSFHIGAGTALLPPLLLTLAVGLFDTCKQQPRKSLPSPQASPLTSSVPESPAPTANQDTMQPPKASQAGDVKTFSGTGVVTSVNRKEGWVEISHGEIKGAMPPMQMAWYVKNISLIGSIKVGDTVSFEIENTRGSPVLTKLEKVQDR